MQNAVWVGVENFAKIESAKICIDNYTLLVGPSNSGKTFLMQLVQGLSDRLIEFIDEDAMISVFVRKIEGYSEFLIHERNINEFVSYINTNLNMRKEQLIKDIFGKEIDIEKLYIEVEIEKGICYQIDITDWKSLSIEAVKESINEDVTPDWIRVYLLDYKNDTFLSERSKPLPPVRRYFYLREQRAKGQLAGIWRLPR